MKKESQKKQIERAIASNVSDQALTWLKWPSNLVFLRGDLSKPQLNMMNEIADVLQGRIQERLKAGRNTIFDPSDFGEDQSFPVSIKMSDIAPTSQYKDIKIVSERLASMTFEIAGRDGNVHGTRIIRLFKEVFIPDDTVRTYKGRSRLQGSLIFKIDQQYADEVWQLGSYTRYLKEVSKACKSQFSIRIYMFITSQLRRGQDIGRWVIGYPQLHSMLGFSVYREATRQKPEQWDKTSYPKYKDFKRRVLEVAYTELNSMDPEHNIDCHFSYREIYPPGKHRGEPASIEFTIYKTPLGKRSDENSKYARECLSLRKEMMFSFGFAKSDCNRILSLVTESTINILRSKVSSVATYIKRHPAVKDTKAYAFKSLYDTALNSIEPAEVEELPVDAISPAEPDTPAPSSQSNPDPILSLSDDQLDAWQQCRALWADRVGRMDFETYFTFIDILYVTCSSVTVSVPNRFFITMIESDDRFNSAFHDGLELMGAGLDHLIKVVR